MEDVRQMLQLITRRFGFLNKNCCTVGGVEVSLAQSHILFEVDRQHRPSMQQLAETLGMDIATFSRQVQSLIQKKLVKKTPLEQDRRVYILELTTEGMFIKGAVDQQMKEYLAQIFSGMNDFERDTVIRSLQLLNAKMEQIGPCCSI